MLETGLTFKLSAIRVTDRRTPFFPSYIGGLSRLMHQGMLRFGRSGLPGLVCDGLARTSLRDADVNRPIG